MSSRRPRCKRSCCMHTSTHLPQQTGCSWLRLQRRLEARCALPILGLLSPATLRGAGCAFIEGLPWQVNLQMAVPLYAFLSAASANPANPLPAPSAPAAASQRARNCAVLSLCHAEVRSCVRFQWPLELRAGTDDGNRNVRRSRRHRVPHTCGSCRRSSAGCSSTSTVRRRASSSPDTTR